MKKLQCRRGARITAVILAAVTLLIAVASVFGTVLVYDMGLYSYELDDADDAKKMNVDNMLYSYAYRITEAYREGYVHENMSQTDAKAAMESVIYEKNLDFELYRSGELLYQSYAGYPPESEYTSMQGVMDTRGGEYSVKFYVHAVKEYVDEFAFAEEWTAVLYNMRYRIIVIGVVSLLLSFLCWLFAVSAAGKRRETEGYVLSMFDRVPLDLMLAIVLFAGFIEVAIFDSYCWYTDDLLTAIFAGIFAFVDSIIVTLLSMTVKVRIMTKTFINNNVITRSGKFVLRLLRRTGGMMRSIIRAVPFFWRTLAVVIGVFAVDFILVVAVANSSGEALVLYFIVWIVFIAAACFAGWNMSRLKTGARRISEGDLEHKIDTQYLLFDFREHAENLNSIGDGMSAAVEERMRGERFKTELITNVSHDIKTPITSIINYVDLLKKCELENEDAKGYIEVLDRQSARLKKLTEDLVTASKASSGVVAVDAKPCELGILVGQAAGEYEEKLAEAGLRLVVSVPEYPVTVMADGKLMWRVFDNLMSNAVKYSLPGTRVYFTLTDTDEYAMVTVSNISRDPISRGAEELTERFVRGDESRHTEGSGLGLSIAKSFVELQGGTFGITTDSDLFKVTVRMGTHL